MIPDVRNPSVEEDTSAYEIAIYSDEELEE